MTFTTPSGYIVEIKDRITYREMRDINSAMLGEMNIDAKNPNTEAKINMAAVYQLQDKAVEVLIVSIKKNDDPSINITSGFVEFVGDMNVQDGEEVYKYVEEKVKEFQGEKKGA